MEELAVLERIAQNPTIKQQELVNATGKSIATVKRIMKSLQDKNYIRRENGKRYGKWEVLVWGDRIFEKCGIRRDEGGDGGKTLEIRGKRRLSARDGGANYQQS